MNDVEATIKKLLNEQVDQRTGPPRPAPAFDPTRAGQGSGRSSRRPWLFPLIAAAAVVVVAAGTVAVTQPSADKRNGPALPNPSPHHTPTATTTHTAGPDQSGTVTLAGATLPLPSGWVARDYVRYDPDAGHGATSGPTEGWCLTPASKSVTVGVCPLWFHTFAHRGLSGPIMDVDNREGVYGNPHQICIPSGVTHSTQHAAERTFGGRVAEWRQWRDDCASGAPFLAEQYVVATAPAYILFSEHADATVHQVMTDLAAHASLPPATSGLRYEDFGRVRRIQAVAAGLRVTIDRTVRDQVADADHTTYDYVVPNRVYAAAANDLKVGKFAQIFTDGTKVMLVYGLSR